jgi:hypothetical protein
MDDPGAPGSVGKPGQAGASGKDGIDGKPGIAGNSRVLTVTQRNLLIFFVLW